MTALEKWIDKEQLKFLVGKAITCGLTGKVLDAPSAVAVTVKAATRSGTLVLTAAAYDKWRADNVPDELPAGVEIEVLDGREIWRR